MKVPFVNLKKLHESIRFELDHAISKVIDSSAFIKSAEVIGFEEEFAQFCESKFCIGVGNGTDALFLCLKALGIGLGDEVLTASNTFIATAEAITAVGATPVFVDIDPSTYLMDLNCVNEKLSQPNHKIKAVIPVHLYGRICPMDQVLSLAKKYNLFVIEDAAQAHGAIWQDKPAGSWGDCGCFSFYPGKNLGAFGDGGAIVTSNADLAQKIRMLSDHGRVSKYDHEFPGYNSRLDALQSAILRVKLKHLPRWNKHRIEAAKHYYEKLNSNDIELPQWAKEGSHVFHLFVVSVKREREKLIAELKSKGIDSGIHYPIILPDLQAYKELNTKHRYPFASQKQDSLLSLPIDATIDSNQINRVVSELLLQVETK